MKKILFVASVNMHIIGFHTPYLKMFKEKGYEVHVASYGNEKIEYCDKHFNIHFERFPFKIKNMKAYKELKNIIEKEQYEIIHCHTPTASVLTRLAARKARKKYNTKVIYTAHGFHFYKGAPIFNWLTYYPIEKVLARYTDCLITINHEDFNLAKRKFKVENIELVNGVGVDENKFNIEMAEEEKNELRKTLGLRQEDLVLIQIGELNKNKRQIMSINAMKDLVKENENIHLLLVGKGQLEQLYRSKIEEYDLQGNIHLLGYRNDVDKLLKISNIAISTSIREGLPVNILEAMCSGVPCVATNNRGHKELIDDGVNGFLIEKSDYNDLTKKILKLSKDKELYSKFVKLEKEKVKKFLLENTIKRMEEIYFKFK